MHMFSDFDEMMWSIYPHPSRLIYWNWCNHNHDGCMKLVHTQDKTCKLFGTFSCIVQLKQYSPIYVYGRWCARVGFTCSLHVPKSGWRITRPIVSSLLLAYGWDTLKSKGEINCRAFLTSFLNKLQHIHYISILTCLQRDIYIPTQLAQVLDTSGLDYISIILRRLAHKLQWAIFKSIKRFDPAVDYNQWLIDCNGHRQLV